MTLTLHKIRTKGQSADTAISLLFLVALLYMAFCTGRLYEHHAAGEVRLEDPVCTWAKARREVVEE